MLISRVRRGSFDSLENPRFSIAWKLALGGTLLVSNLTANADDPVLSLPVTITVATALAVGAVTVWVLSRSPNGSA
jgi:hypothetical protein